MEFNNKRSYNELYNVNLASLEGHLSSEDSERLAKIRRAWNFYEGYHWEDIPPIDKPEITENYCRAFVNKFVSFELGEGFNTKYSEAMRDLEVNEEGDTIEDYLDKVWDFNNYRTFCIELGQSKSITGDAWIQVRHFSKDELDDPFDEYPKGMIKVMVVPTNIVFPEYDTYDRSKLTKLTVMYPVEREDKSPILRRHKISKVIYKQVWTKDEVAIYEGKDLIALIPNDYGVIPFVQIKNYPVAGKSDGISDLEDLIPLNTELNMKKSDISEVIDYHSAPITVVYGARISTLEKGANKVWGGLPKDSRVQNLELDSDLGASLAYIDRLKTAIHEIGGIPEGALGGSQQISNTSGVALQFVNMPLIERTNVKMMGTTTGLEQVVKLVLHLSVHHELINKPEGVSNYDFYYSEVSLPDSLPKDRLIELQEIEAEMRLELESREGALDRLGRENKDRLLRQIDEDQERVADREFRSQAKREETQLNSGMLNGETPIEMVRKEVNDSNSSVDE